MDFVFKIEPELTLNMQARDSEEPVGLFFDGPEDLEKRVVSFLFEASGPFGHPVLDDSGMARPGDIHFVLTRSALTWKLVKGIIAEYKSAPEGCQS
jgi:hypothetical protein